MKMASRALIFMFFFITFTINVSKSQDYDEEESSSSSTKKTPPAPPPAFDSCNGIYLSYEFISRTKELPHVKNATAQAWAFKSTATVLNAGTVELEAWKMFIGFQHHEILVSASGAQLMDGSDFPASVGNGTSLSGSSSSVLKTSIETAGDMTQIQAQIDMTGTQFGVKPTGVPMPSTIKLDNDGWKCPKPTQKKTSMHVCCKRDPKYKVKTVKKKYYPRQNGDLTISYDVIQAYESSYLAQVQIDNINPLGRLDHWNLTWEWMRGEFIYTMKGAYTHKIDYADCIYGEAGTYYASLDFSKIMNCEKKPIIADLPKEKAKDEQVGNIPGCCRNGTLLPVTMDPSQSKAVFQVNVYKLPPDDNRTALYPPEKWKINGLLNPVYKCGQPLRVDATEFPDTSGLQATTMAIASWQIVCNITTPKERSSRCCVSYSAYYNDSAVPCDTCACGCDSDSDSSCNQNAQAMLLPSEALLVPFDNRTDKAKAWAKIKHFPIPKPLPCPDNCGVSLNWHISSDYRSGWTARITLFNWDNTNFENWFAAVQIKKAYAGYENVYSFNGTLLPEMNHTIFMQGIEGLNYLMAEANGTKPTDPRVPGKQQSVISFTKAKTPGIKVAKGDGFPTKVFFNGEQCDLPKRFPIADGNRNRVKVLPMFLLSLLTLIVIANQPR